ncbi:hypothetical protein UVI_02061890 [Ustilaginoidea virens]|uniref:Uncharacterized protein n=1 Tax=Ustilaginoidea virens TaxID=1159556 RepID=A0A1B5L8P6_USTVR|nr:hypothetical protein UVI_02061890 [Ustilaginoidea virens]
MQMPPFWLTSRTVDGFKDADEIAEYNAILAEYLEIYAAEEKRRNGVALEAPIQRHMWRKFDFERISCMVDLAQRGKLAKCTNVLKACFCIGEDGEWRRSKHVADGAFAV